MDSIKIWFKSLIRQYRDECILPVDSQFNLNKFWDLQPPIQITVLELVKNQKIFQIILVCHNPDEKDGICEFFGQFITDEETDMEKLDSILTPDNFFKYLMERSDFDREKLLVSIRKSLDVTDQPNKLLKSFLFNSDTSYLGLWTGRIQDNSIQSIIEYLSEEQIQETKHMIRILNHIEPPPLTSLYGGFLIPPYWIGNFPEVNSYDLLKKKVLFNYLGSPMKLYFGDVTYYITKDGYISINHEYDGKNWLKIEILNERKQRIKNIISLLILNGYKIQYNTMDFLSAFSHYDPRNDKIGISHAADSKVEAIWGERNNPINSVTLKKNRIHISEEILYNLIAQAEEMRNDPKNQRLFRICIDAIFHIQRGEYDQCFILGWTIIEQYITRIWKEYYTSRNVNSSRRKNFEGRDYTISVICEILELASILERNDYQAISKLRKKRNKFIHDLNEISHEDAKQALNFALNFVRRIYSNLKEEKLESKTFLGS